MLSPFKSSISILKFLTYSTAVEDQTKAYLIIALHADLFYCRTVFKLGFPFFKMIFIPFAEPG
jgi:hypothetical protein